MPIVDAGADAPRRFDVQGHRGARGLFPENTLEGFLAAAARGIAAFELDVGMTRDGVAVVSHDPALNPELTRDNGTWLPRRGPLIHALSCAELGRYDVGRARPRSRTARLFPDQAPMDGARIPTLASVLSALPTSRFTVEVKTDPRHPDRTAPAAAAADAVLAAVDAAGAGGRVTIESFDWRVQRHVRGRRPEIRLAWLTQPDFPRGAARRWRWPAGSGSVPCRVAVEAGCRPASAPGHWPAAGGPAWAPAYTDLSEAAVREAHALGLAVLPWTVNRRRDMARLMDWGVDGLTSDWPDRALSLAMERWRLREP